MQQVTFSKTPEACRICDAWDARRRKCSREWCKYTKVQLTRRAELARKGKGGDG